MPRGWFVFLLAFATGCAGPSRNTTWEQDEADGVAEFTQSTDVAPRRAVAKRRSIALDSTLDSSVDFGARAAELELGLVAFAAGRAKIASGLAPVAGAGWPKPIVKVFDEVLTTVERALVAPPGAVPGRVLIQTRVALEVGLDQTKRKFGAPPIKIGDRVRASYVGIAIHMRSLTRGYARRGTKPRYRLSLSWPLSPLIVTSPFGYRRDPILGQEEVRFHAGVDLGGDKGDVVASAGPGRVLSVGWKGGHGRTVVVQHAGGISTMYAHLKRALVEPGVEVHRGSPIGLVGSSGRSTGPHLHFEVRRGSVPIDPVDAIGLGLGSLASSD